MIFANPDFTGFTAQFVGYLLAFVLGTTFARYFQALVAGWLGDRQPRNEGRLSLNPGRHHEPLGLVLALILAFSAIKVATWGKPLNLNPYANRLKRLGSSMVALVGPVGYLLVALVARLVFIPLLNNSNLQANSFSLLVYDFILANCLYAAFDLLPLPPLDGWWFLKGLWPAQWDTKVVWVETYGVVLVLVVTFVLPLWLGPNFNFAYTIIFKPLVTIFLSLLGLNLQV